MKPPVNADEASEIRETNDAQEVNENRREFNKWLWRLPVIAALGGAGYAAWRVYEVQFSKVKPVENPQFDARANQEISELTSVQELWTTMEFTLEGIPSILIHVPEAIPGGLSIEGQHFIAFSRICTHQACIVQPNQNYEAIAVSYNYRTTSPVLACNCHFSIFDILKAGEAVSGPAVLPLPRIQLDYDAGKLYAVGIERS